MRNFVKRALQAGGTIKPLVIPSNLTGGTGLMNPSVYNDNGKILVNVRHVNYTFYHSEAKLFLHPWGPLTYLHPENDQHLRTRNFYCELNDALGITRFNEIDMKFGDTYEPLWEFVGLEDARLIRWEEKLFITGVRRDTTTNGQGRMELSEIVVSPTDVKEISRFRIPAPVHKDSYCEKNWMPILDQPFHYVKWTAPTEVVKVDIAAGTCSQVKVVDNPGARRDIRGGTQIVPFGKDHYIAMTHEVDLFNSEVGRKDAVYHHRFVMWDRDWNLVKYSREFFMMDAQVEFGVGMCHVGDKGDVLITFGFQDNAAYILRVPQQVILDFINENS